MTGWSIDPTTGQPYPFFQGAWTGNPDPNAYNLGNAWNWALNTQPQTPFEKTLDATLNVPKSVNALGNAYQNYAVKPLAKGVDWFFNSKPPEVAKAPEPAPVQLQPTLPTAGPGATTFSIPGQFINYMDGLPNVGLPRVALPQVKDRAGQVQRPELPTSPDFSAARDAMKAASPGKFEEQDWTTRGNDIWMFMLPGILSGLADNANSGGTIWQGLLRAAAGGAMGTAQFSKQQKTEKREFAKDVKEYQRWLAANETNMTQNEFSNALQRATTAFNADAQIAQIGQGNDRNKLAVAQLQHSINAAGAELGLKSQALKYEAGLKQQEQMAPKITGHNLISRGADGSYQIKNIDPMSGVYANLLSGGSLPANAYSTKNLMANLPLEARSAISPMIAEIQKDPNFIAMTSGLGGADMADVAVMNQLQMRLQAAAKAGNAQAAGALMQINQALARGALMQKMKPE